MKACSRRRVHLAHRRSLVTGGLRFYGHGIRRKPGEAMFEGARPETSNDILTELARLGETRSWEPGATVVTEGDAADCMHLIHEGELTLAVNRAPPAGLSPRGPPGMNNTACQRVREQAGLGDLHVHAMRRWLSSCTPRWKPSVKTTDAGTSQWRC